MQREVRTVASCSACQTNPAARVIAYPSADNPLHRLYRLTPLNAPFASRKSLRHWAAVGRQALPPTSATADTAQERQA
jgi:hypothetical protein